MADFDDPPDTEDTPEMYDEVYKMLANNKIWPEQIRNPESAQKYAEWLKENPGFDKSGLIV